MRNISLSTEKLFKLIKTEKRNFSLQSYLHSLQANIASRIDLSAGGIRKFLTIILGISLIYLGAAFIYPIFGLNKIRLPDVAREKKLPVKQKTQEESKPLEFYTQETGNRQIFSSSGNNPAAANPAAAVNADVIKGINLVGIISGANPQAIIEDKETQRSFYLSRGQFLGELRIEDIQESKVILSYRGVRYELSM
jgi:type II secretory pathway component PulC